MHQPFREPQSYPVEVSGWDIAENFFVEETLLDWSSDALKDIVLRTRIRDGAVIFLRLREHGNGMKSIPVAYQAMFQNEPSSDGSAHLRLQKLRAVKNPSAIGDEDSATDNFVRA